MRTAIVSDLHLGTVSGADIARHPEVFERLCAAVSEADRVVVLGDLLEMRERRSGEVLEIARPLLSALGDATAGLQLVMVPGNHDHELVAPALDRARLDGRTSLPLESTFEPGDGELSRRVAELHAPDRGPAGLSRHQAARGRLGDPRPLPRRPPHRAAGSSASSRRPWRASPRRSRRASAPSPDVYEAALAPIYAFAYSVVQWSEGAAVTRGGNLSRSVWQRTNPSRGRPGAKGLALRAAIPVAVRAINLLGLGPFRSDISAQELRRAGLRAMATVVESLGIEAEHVIFGHTHRAGPLPGDAEGWRLPGGARLTNTGSWLYEDGLRGRRRAVQPLLAGAGDVARGRGAAPADGGARRPRRGRAARVLARAGRRDGVGLLDRGRLAGGRRAACPARGSPSGSSRGRLAHSSSKSTFHLPSSSSRGSIFSLARKLRPERPRKPVTAFSVRPIGGSSPRSSEALSDAISSLATATGRFLPAFFFQITKPQPGSSFDQHE